MKNFFYLIFFISSIFVFSQKKILLFTKELNSKEQNDFVKNNNIGNLIIINQDEFAPNDSLSLELLKKSIESRIPDPNEEGYAALDWEGKGMESFSDNNSSRKEYFIYKFVVAITYVKKLRPKLKWAFYGLPTREFWNINDDWEKRNNSLLPIFKSSDYIAPSFYLLHNENEISSVLTENYISKNLLYSLKLGKKYNKPVIPFIWHRFHPSNKNYGLQVIPYRLFSNYMDYIFKQNYSGTSVSGIIWWHAEKYYYRKKDTFTQMIPEYKDVKNPEQHQLTIFKNYYEIIKPFLSKKY